MSEAALELREVSATLGRHLALERVNLKVPAGVFLAIIGPNGAGKTTLLKVALGIVEPSSGVALTLGMPPAKLEAHMIGYVPQLKTLDRAFPALVIELVATGLRAKWPGRMTREETDKGMAALDRVGAAHLARRQIGRLSGGELQRVYLARSFVREPKLILLDEPAAGIDVVGQGDLYAILDRYAAESGATIMMITHDWGVAYHHADLALVMNRTVIGFGAPAEALNEESLRAAFGHVGHSHAMKMKMD